MRIILMEDVAKLGKKGDVVDVSDGYARNMLLPKKLGIIADSKNLNELKGQKKRDEKNAAEVLAQAQALALKIEEKTIEVKMKAGEGGRVFGSVSSKEIAAEAKKQHGFEIDKKKIVLSEPVKSFGYTEVPVKLHPQVTATMKVHVTEL
ncbi:MAG: 50S ribosomal protein L9 [Lachnospiraceae bacterium]|nr:50S ribosomal protein L9 [Lachnospiraceae bacterium]